MGTPNTKAPLEGRGFGEKLAVALYGPVALTEGGRLASDYSDRLDDSMRATRTAERELIECWRNQIASQIAGHIIEGDAQLFRDIAEWIDRNAASKRGEPYDPAFLTALEYVHFCRQHDKRAFVRSTAAGLSARCLFSTIDRVMDRPSFVPTVRELYDHLKDVLRKGTIPAKRTVSRWAPLLGIKAEPAPTKRTTRAA